MPGKVSPLSASRLGRYGVFTRDAGLSELWARQVEVRPEAIALQQGMKRVTYDALNRRASRLAGALRELGVGEETPVAVGLRQGIEAIVAHVALCKLGATCVPIDLEHPPERIGFVVTDSGAEVLLTGTLADEARCGEWPATRLCLERDGEQVARRSDVLVAPLGDGGRRTHVLYTSGTTGRPKGIELVARGIRRMVIDTDYVSIDSTDRVAQISNHAFDAALFEVWGALLNGASLVLLPRSSVLDASAFRDALRETHVSVLLMTTALFNLVAQGCPDAFGTLKYLLVGGERANPRTFRAVLERAPPAHLLNLYGPTEGTTVTTTHEVRPGDVLSGSVPIGRPIRHTQVFVLGPDLRPVEPGVMGELCIGGEGLARGYLNRRELTEERFPVVPELAPGPPLRMYRTGDLARWREDGTLEFLGRADHQVKLRGHRIELEEVARLLLESGLLWDAVVTLQEHEDGEKSLAAYVVPKSTGTGSALQDALRARVPEYMVPARIIELERLPTTVNGKVDRGALPVEVSPRGAPGLATSGWAPEDAVASEVGAVWAELLGLKSPSLEDDFLRLGGNSLLAARLVMRLRELYGLTLSAYSLYEARTLGVFLDVVRRARAGQQDSGRAADGPEAWRADAKLPEYLRRAPVQPAPRVVPLESMELVFLTGATGFLGAFLLRDLLRMTRARVACLVRARDVDSGHARLRQALEKYDLWEDSFAERLRPVLGDLGAPSLGLSPQVFQEFATRAEALFHLGAHVNYVQPYSAHRAANVEGTTEVLRLAMQGRPKPVHYVSTIAVFGPTGYFNGRAHVREGEGLDEHLECLRYDIGYSASKWVAEKRVWAAASRGVAVNVYRPGFIMGDSHTGVGNADDFVARFIRGCIQLGTCPDLPRQRKEFVPVDFVSRAILGIASREGAVGKAYHLVPPRPEDSVDINDFYALLARCGYPLSRVPYKEWVERLMRDARVADNALCPLVPMLYEQVYAGETTRWELHEDMPVYDAHNTFHALEGRDAGFRKMDAGLLGRYLAHWRRLGLLAAPG
ncbi:amino acid adenylation domain-containing protein [Myxococcus llanfairpwllgwyngyllgogerychwyrndrobwllllantysiliogogogochensis]|uniref:Amino acid adenylation domain-containing protein n=1 Tax=Myxococcus llanfairpwllgwyngyllgogerychwyrndrobwllllantysiliogogogochensis TaxID=2590453 RepID=A0A540X1S0_9BACT|nr:amino acid adenylation domain-containing protein [Myxococcus llanfairpwllgwyngyllgogerychwyrndrobwllllantysiliogogogochensis]TQF15170.1 amino acid adenylation domain-containing protein [Myxococcus llanfairpwllgwyngyllgogerychwyrndrobwllllantysiliogogogochensis]